MAVPKFQNFMRPALDFLMANGQQHVSAIREHAIQLFKLTEEELAETNAGGQKVLVNRNAWALTHLRLAGLVRRVETGVYAIAENGSQFLKQHAGPITYQELKTCPEYVEYLSKHRKSGSSKSADVKPSSKESEDEESQETPQERMAAAYDEIRSALAEDLLDRVKALSPQQFEQLVVDLIVKMGYGGSRRNAGLCVGGSGDGGIDGIINQDILGLDVIYIQAKRWEKTVGRPLIQAFVGSLEGRHASKGVVLTTAYFSQTAIDYAEGVSKQINIIDGTTLVQHMIDFGLGAQTAESFHIPSIDLDYFASEA